MGPREGPVIWTTGHWLRSTVIGAPGCAFFLHKLTYLEILLLMIEILDDLIYTKT